MSASKTETNLPLSFEQVCKAALTLPLEDREQLTAELCRSIEEEQKEIEQLWLEEVKRRAQQHREGKAKTIPHEEVMRMIEKELDAMESEAPQ